MKEVRITPVCSFKLCLCIGAFFNVHLHPAQAVLSASQPCAGTGRGCCLTHNIGQDSNMEHSEEDGEGTVAPGLPAVIMMYNLIEGCASILHRTQTALLLSMHYSG